MKMASGSSAAPAPLSLLSKDMRNSADDFENIMNRPPSTSTNKVVSNSSLGSTINDFTFDTSKFKLQTKNPVFQQVEIEALEESTKLQTDIQSEIIQTRGDMKTKHIKYSEKFLSTQLCDILDIVGDVESFEDIIKKLEELTKSVNHKDTCKTCRPEGHEVNTSNFKKPPLPPSKTAKTAVKNLSDTFSSINSSSSNNINESSSSNTSSNKVPRAYQPGEILFSKNFSPLVIPFPNSNEEDRFKTPPGIKERLQVADGRNKIEIDVVLKAGKGGKDEQKLFSEFMTGVKQIKTAKTTVTQKRVMPPRVPQKPKETKTIAENSSASSSSSQSASSSRETAKKSKKEATPPAKRTRVIENKFKKQGEWVI